MIILANSIADISQGTLHNVVSGHHGFSCVAIIGRTLVAGTTSPSTKPGGRRAQLAIVEMRDAALYAVALGILSDRILLIVLPAS